MPETFILDGNIHEWRRLPPVREFRRSSVTVTDALWLGQSRNGLVVAGFFPGDRTALARNVAELGNGGRVEVWLSAAEPVDLPEIKADEDTCASISVPAQEKAFCEQWVEEQTAYREQLTRLFTRMWKLAPPVAQEAYALPAYDALSELERKALRFPRPEGLPTYKFQTASDGVVSFEILIPWELFPPADRLTLESVRLRVDVTSGGWATLSTDPNTHIVDDEELPWIAVSPPIVARITTCGQPLLAKSLEGEYVPAYYFLNRTREVSAAFLLENQEIPYDTVFPRHDEVSPGARYREFFTQELDKGEFLCWPFMSYRKGAVVRQFSYRVEPSGDQLSTVPQDHLAVKRLADGTRLIRYGPDTANGPLWHRAMFGFETRIYSLTPSLQAEEALSLYGMSDGGQAYEIEMSDDWRTVTEYRRENGPWSSETHCLTGRLYRSCGKNPNSPPPKKRVLTSDP